MSQHTSCSFLNSSYCLHVFACACSLADDTFYLNLPDRFLLHLSEMVHVSHILKFWIPWAAIPALTLWFFSTLSAQSSQQWLHRPWVSLPSELWAAWEQEHCLFIEVISNSWHSNKHNRHSQNISWINNRWTNQSLLRVHENYLHFLPFRLISCLFLFPLLSSFSHSYCSFLLNSGLK